VRQTSQFGVLPTSPDWNSRSTLQEISRFSTEPTARHLRIIRCCTAVAYSRSPPPMRKGASIIRDISCPKPNLSRCVSSPLSSNFSTASAMVTPSHSRFPCHRRSSSLDVTAPTATAAESWCVPCAVPPGPSRPSCRGPMFTAHCPARGVRGRVPSTA